MFEIIEECDVHILLERELYYGLMFNVLEIKTGLNSRLPKSGEHYTFMSEDTKRKIGKANKGKSRKYGHYKSLLKKLTEEQVLEIKKLLVENQLTQKEIGLLYKVSRKIIGNINTGKTYNTLHTNIDLKFSKKKYVKLMIEDYENIKTLNKQKMSQKKIAEYYNVDQSHISRILNNEGYIKTLLKEGGGVKLAVATGATSSIDLLM